LEVDRISAQIFYQPWDHFWTFFHKFGLFGSLIGLCEFFRSLDFDFFSQVGLRIFRDGWTLIGLCEFFGEFGL
jgi:hypothetical protein